MKEGPQKVDKDDQAKSEVDGRGSGKRGKLDQTTNQLRVEIYMHFELPVCLQAAFATMPLLAQVFKKGQLPPSPLQEPDEEEELALLTLLIQGSSSPQDQGNLSRTPLKCFNKVPRVRFNRGWSCTHGGVCIKYSHTYRH